MSRDFSRRLYRDRQVIDARYGIKDLDARHGMMASIKQKDNNPMSGAKSLAYFRAVITYTTSALESTFN